MRKRQAKPCAYCENPDARTVDHIPPRSIFPEKLPPGSGDLLTVPACGKCHQGTSLDDEYFRAVLLGSNPIGEVGASEEAVSKMLRGLERPQAAGFRNRLYAESVEVEKFSPAGISLGAQLEIRFDSIRFERVACRIMRGTFYHETGLRVPVGAIVTNTVHPDWKGVPNKLRQYGPWRIRRFGNGAYKYAWYMLTQEWDPRANLELPEKFLALCIAIYYDSLCFMGRVASAGVVALPKRKGSSTTRSG